MKKLLVVGSINMDIVNRVETTEAQAPAVCTSSITPLRQCQYPTIGFQILTLNHGRAINLLLEKLRNVI